MCTYDEQSGTYRSPRKANKPLGPDAPHYPNKYEAKELRRLMALTGDSEEVVRSSLKNRQLLAKAAKAGAKDDTRIRARELKQLKKDVARKLKLPVFHPNVMRTILKDHPEFGEE